jgi:peptide methionine sulfoxide reductase MsrB
MRAQFSGRGRCWAGALLLLLAGGALAAIAVVGGRGRRVKGGDTAPVAIQGAAAEIMSGQGAHGTCAAQVQNPLRWGADRSTADNICCFNRHYAERAGSWERTSFLADRQGAVTTFYDSVTGRPLFRAPVGRTWDEFVRESAAHGWPSFRDAEVVPQHTRVLEDGEVVSEEGTHLGHNLPDGKGNRYCINLVSVAGFERAAEGRSTGPQLGPTTSTR